jgi:copper chaperone CopZ
MATGSATIQVSGVRCERCIGRLAGALRGHEGIEYANANLMGEVSLRWDEDRTTRDEIVAVLRRSGFLEITPHIGARKASSDRENP